MHFIVLILSLFSTHAAVSATWSYDGISGPSFWGLINPEWEMCNKGKRQSPINIETNKLLLDRLLGDLLIGEEEVSGVLQNTGQSLVFKVANESDGVTFTGGPLSYNYQLDKITFHYGPNDIVGSEHQINGKQSPGELQFYAYNKDLYHNMSEAQQKPQGVAVVSVMVHIGDSSPELRLITSSLTKVVYKDRSHPIDNLNINSLLPNIREYLTYEGSWTEPGCWESVVWIIYNKPIYISVQEMYAMRKLVQGTEDSPKSPLSNNARPVQPSQLTVRTNIKPGGRLTDNNCAHWYTETESSGYEQEGDPTLISSKQ